MHLSSEHGEASSNIRLRPRRANNDQQTADNGAQFFLRTAPIDDDDTSQPAAFSSIKKESLFYYTTPQRPDEADIDYEQLVNRTRIKPASMDQCHQEQLLPDHTDDNGNNTRPIELIPYLLELEQTLMPVLPIVKQKKSKRCDDALLLRLSCSSFVRKEPATIIYQRRFQVLLDYLYGPQRCAQISELIRLHLRSRLVLNTLFLTVNLFDRAILTGQIPRESYSDGNPRLLLTCLLIAGKFEEVEVSFQPRPSTIRPVKRIRRLETSVDRFSMKGTADQSVSHSLVAKYQLSDCSLRQVGSARYQIFGDYCSSISLVWHRSHSAGFRLSLLWSFASGHLE